MSNFDSRLYEILIGLSIDRFFDSVTLSSFAGAAKPSPAIFQRALRKHGVAARDALHIGRDAPLGVALILHLLATTGVTVSELVASSPRYTIVKAKGPRGPKLGPLYDRLRARFTDADVDERDGLRLSWRDRWLHVRPSGTEPIVRLIAEAPTKADAESLVAAARELLQ